MPLYAQAYGNLFVPALLLVIGLGVKLRAIDERNPSRLTPTCAAWPARTHYLHSGGKELLMSGC